LYIRM